jgi:hypothetical protein
VITAIQQQINKVIDHELILLMEKLVEEDEGVCNKM